MKRTGQIRMKSNVIALLSLTAVLAALGATSGASASPVSQAQEHHAGLVLQYSDGTVQTYCIPFTGDSISGLDLLLKTGLDVKVEAYGAMGGEICKIGKDGCDFPAQPCACQSYGQGGIYWSYHHLKDGKWVTSGLGASSYKVHDGDVDGWAYSNGKPPTLHTYQEICGVPAPVLTPTATHKRPSPTKRPATTPIPTRQPTSTWQPDTPTPTELAQPLASTPTAQPQTTSTATLTVLPTETPAPTQIPTEDATPTASPPTTSTPPDCGGGANAGLIGAVAAGAAALAFVLWRALTSARSGRRDGTTGESNAD